MIYRNNFLILFFISQFKPITDQTKMTNRRPNIIVDIKPNQPLASQSSLAVSITAIILLTNNSNIEQWNNDSSKNKITNNTLVANMLPLKRDN